MIFFIAKYFFRAIDFYQKKSVQSAVVVVVFLFLKETKLSIVLKPGVPGFPGFPGDPGGPAGPSRPSRPSRPV